MQKFCLAFLLVFFSYSLNGAYCNKEACCEKVKTTEQCCTKDCGHWFVTAEILYWKAHEDNLVYAIDGVSTPNQGSSKELDWNWYPGFKVGLGYILPCSTIDSYLNYTWFRSNAKDSAYAQNATTPLFPTFAPDATIASLTSGFSEWTLHYNTLDLELGNWFCACERFLFHPSIGLRAAFTQETDHITYNFPVQDLYNFKQSFNGVGPRIGLNSRWFFCNNMSFFADGAFAILWGSYHVTFKEIIGFNSTLADTEHNFDTLRNLVDLRLGIDWSFTLCNAYNFTLGIAWEQRLWLKHNQYLRYHYAAPSSQRDNDGDLSLYGVDVNFKFCY